MVNKALKKFFQQWFVLACLAVLGFSSPAVCADFIVDNSGTGTTSNGTWSVSGGADPYGANSLWSRDGATYSWSFTPADSGTYAVSMWWTVWPSRSTSVPVDIQHAGGTTRITVNQQTGGQAWNPLGQYPFEAGTSYQVTVTAQPFPASTCADAVMFSGSADNSPPLAADDMVATDQDVPILIDVITNDIDVDGSIDPGSLVVTADPENGFVEPHVDGSITYTPDAEFTGTDTFSYTVADNEGAVSDAATVTVTVQGEFISVEIDNGSLTTSSTGTWSVSGGTDPYGADSLWSRDGATYSWSFTPADSGTYAVSMWWTVWPSRSTSVPVDIQHAGGTTRRYINQQINGGQWNSLGNYAFESGQTYTVTITAQPGPTTSTCADAVAFDEVAGPPDPPDPTDPPTPPGPEDIFICYMYGAGSAPRAQVISVLEDLGAVDEGGAWRYTNPQLDKTFYIHFVSSIAGMRDALATEGAHIITTGHSNYGLGPIFSYDIDNVRYIDDDLIFNLSSPWIHVSVSGMRTGQPFPNWWPEFKDGTSGIMPYDFDDPQGDPPYNYYITYQVPGDPAHYMVETDRRGAVERFPDSGRPAWFSADGSPPDPNNPDHQQYFITNPEPWYPSFESYGDWTPVNTGSGFFKENYIYAPAGSGNRAVDWIFQIPTAGEYKVFAWWPAAATRTATAPYTVNHGLGATTVLVNQRINGGQWNEIGQFFFNEGETTVTLDDDTSSGTVAADAVRIAHVNNPPELIQAHFYAYNRSGPAPLDVRFFNQSTGDYTERHWDFGDGATNDSRDYITHTYDTPGTYSVELTVAGPSGSDAITKTTYITVGDAPPPLLAEFSVDYREGLIPLETGFEDRSSGDIVSWSWDFGDGQVSVEQNPFHTYTIEGNYTVSLTVTDSNGSSDTVVKENLVLARIYDKSIDNVDYPKTHYRRKTILFRNAPDMDKSEFKYARMFYSSCNSGNYYMDTFNRGILFYTLNTSSGRIDHYLKAYLQGKSDWEIWQILQNSEPVYDYYNFNKYPSGQ